MLSLTLKVGQSITIGEGTTIRLEHRLGRAVRVVIDSIEFPIKVHEDGAMPPRSHHVSSPLPELPEAEILPFRRGAYWGLAGELRIA